jgi:sugar phosphate isomerase/epimerase
MRLSLQLYTLRDALSVDVLDTLTQVKGIGLEYVELAGTYGRSGPEWRTMLDSAGLKASGAHVGLDLIEGDLDAVIADAKAIGYRYVIVPWVNKDNYAGAWDKFAESLVPVGDKLKEAGLQLAYHNHAFEFEDDGLDKFYAAAPKETLVAELDLAWIQIGGADPAAYIEKMAGRVPLVHLKDYDPAQTPQWRPAGQGIVDWDGVLTACANANVEFGCIELDESPGEPIDAVRASVEYFQGRGLL